MPGEVSPLLGNAGKSVFYTGWCLPFSSGKGRVTFPNRKQYQYRDRKLLTLHLFSVKPILDVESPAFLYKK